MAYHLTPFDPFSDLITKAETRYGNGVPKPSLPKKAPPTSRRLDIH